MLIYAFAGLILGLDGESAGVVGPRGPHVAMPKVVDAERVADNLEAKNCAAAVQLLGNDDGPCGLSAASLPRSATCSLSRYHSNTSFCIMYRLYSCRASRQSR